MTTTENSIAAPLAEHAPPSDRAHTPSWGSDAIVDLLQRAGIRRIALNPGASFRGLHDSLVNYAGVDGPEMMLCLHEEHAVAIAHGWAKITGQPMAVALHSNVGLMHATMALYNAWCDRVPMLVIGATGPLDASRRRPWIDWIHTSSDQPALVRNFIKWDDTPTSLPASLESLARAWDITRTAPTAPTYVVLDTTVQEQPLTEAPVQPTITPGLLPDQPTASRDSVARAAEILTSAQRPVLLAGPGRRDQAAWDNRIRLAEALGARVVTDLKAGSMFPTRHPAHVAGAGFFVGASAREVLSQADAVLALNWIDVAGTLAQAGTPPSAPVVSATLEPLLANGWSKDHQGRTAAKVWLPAEPDTAVTALLDHLPDRRSVSWRPATAPEPLTGSGPITLNQLSASLQESLKGVDTTLARLPLGWDGDTWDFDQPLAFLGYDGGGGIGSGLGMTIGAALALRDQGRMTVSVLGDGDYMMGAQAIWTAVNQQIPSLVVVANNRSYFNDEVHQERVANTRGRDASRKWVGQRIDDPAPDLAGIARAQGATAYGPVTDRDELGDVLRAAVANVQDGAFVVVDVVVQTGYTPAMAAGLTRDHS